MVRLYDSTGGEPARAPTTQEAIIASASAAEPVERRSWRSLPVQAPEGSLELECA